MLMKICVRHAVTEELKQYNDNAYVLFATPLGSDSGGVMFLKVFYCSEPTEEEINSHASDSRFREILEDRINEDVARLMEEEDEKIRQKILQEEQQKQNNSQPPTPADSPRMPSELKTQPNQDGHVQQSTDQQDGESRSSGDLGSHSALQVDDDELLSQADALLSGNVTNLSDLNIKYDELLTQTDDLLGGGDSINFDQLDDDELLMQAEKLLKDTTINLE
jgi:hypothetical protein